MKKVHIEACAMREDVTYVTVNSADRKLRKLNKAIVTAQNMKYSPRWQTASHAI